MAQGAEIDYAYDWTAGELSCTSCSSITNITGVNIDSSEFTNGDEYLIIASASFGGTSTSGEYAMGLYIGNEPLFDGWHRGEPAFTAPNTMIHPYLYHTFWTADGVSDVHLKWWENSGTIYGKHFMLFAINVDDLSAGDYYTSYSSTTEVLNVVNTWENTTSIGFTPTDSSDDWLIIGHNQVDWPSTSSNTKTRMTSAGDFNENQPLRSQEGEDPDDLWVQSLFRVFPDLDTTWQEFKMESTSDGVTASEIDYSRITALRLNAFATHNYTWTETSTTTESDNAWAGTQIIPDTIFTPTVTGDIFAMTQSITDASGNSKQRILLDTDGGATQNYDMIDGQTQDTAAGDEYNGGWDASDENPTFFAVINNTNTDKHTITQELTQTSTRAQEDRSSVIFSMELAGGAGSSTGETSDEIALEDSVSIIYDHTVNTSDEIALEDDSITASATGSDTVTIEDEIALEDYMIGAQTDTVFVSDEIALEDGGATNDAVAQQLNAIILRLNSPLTDRLGGVFAITCPSNHTMTGIFTNGTAICTDLSDFFP